uniref:RNA-directed DNA polymerase, eukaryota, reverse transcriptase zinc-binding domain protein n=1 Tax=Tanacetum cinerariifolium TaxID=118510 RepID=A0A6L2NAQ1_TANCI|nr:RNA-directed DNA polymerase, eukaryota, reverse transcriptase zinc-binding domain protein [Tanacetum cinerariifolium]
MGNWQAYLQPQRILTILLRDLSWTGLPECKDDTVTDYSRPEPTIEISPDDAKKRNPSVSETVSSPITPKPFVKFVKASDSQSKSKTDETKTPKKSPVKYAEQYRKTNNKPNVRGNKRNWNNLKSHQLGPDFVMKKKACFNCGDFNHLAYDCRKRVKRGTTRKFSTGSRNFPTANRKFPTASRNFLTGSMKFSTTDMGMKGKAGSSQNNIDDKGYWDSGCSRHMTGNISYLSDYELFDGGYVSFGQGGCKITGKGTIKTGKLEFKNVYFVKDLKYNLFSVSQIYDNKNSVLFTDSECIVLRRDFKLLDDANMLLRTPRQHNMYSINLNNIIPHKDLTCLVAKASADEWKQHKASCKSKLVNSVSKPLHTVYMDFFGPTSDETSGILKKFIFEIENLKDLRVKIIRCDNGREFQNKEMNDFCSKKGSKKSLAMLGLLSIMESLKQKGMKATLLGIQCLSKAFKVLNKRTKRVKENLHMEFLENKAIEKGAGPNWLFDIDSLTKSMNYVPVVDAGINSTNFLGTKDAAGQEVKKDVSTLRYIALPNWAHDAFLESSSSKSQDDWNTDVLESSENTNPTATSTIPPADQVETLTVESPIPTASSPVLTACFTDSQEPSSETRLILKRVANQEETPSLDNILTLTNRFEDILRVTTNSEESNEVEADVSNMKTTITASPTPTLRIHRDHPKSQIIGHVDTPIQTRNKFKEEELLQFKIQKVWTLVDCPKGVRPIGTKWVLKNNKDKRGIVIRNKARLVAQGHTQEEGIDYDEVFAPVARIESIRLFLAYASFMGFTVYQMDVKSAFLYGTIDEEVLLELVEKEDGIFLSQDKYVGDILKKFGYSDVRSLNTPMDKENPWGKDGTRKDVDLRLYRSMIGCLMYLTASRLDIMFDVCACARHQVIPKECHLHAVKRIFRYLKGHPKLGLWYPKDSPFDLVAYSNSDYGGATRDCKSTTGRCQIFKYSYGQGESLGIGWHQVKPKECHLHAVKRIYRYLKGHPKLGLWYPKDSLFDLVAYSDSDYGGATQDRKSTTRGCQFLGRRLISWQCKKQTTVATSTTEAEYVAAASCCGQGKLSTVSVFLGFGLTIAGWACHNTDFHQIVDFVGASHIRYALTFNPTIYVSHIRQFWSTARIETTDEGTKILATVDGILRTVTESSIRRNLKLNDEEGINEPTSPMRDVSQGEACPIDFGFVADQDKANIAKTSTLPYESTSRVTSLATNEGSLQLQLKARVKFLEDRQGEGINLSGDDTPIKGRTLDEEEVATERVSSDTEEIRLDEGEVAAERVSDDTEEMAIVLITMDATSILLSRGVQVVPTAAAVSPANVSISTGSGVVPTASTTISTAAPIFATDTTVTPYARRKGKEKMVETHTPKKKKDEEITKIHAEEELQQMIEGLDRSNETIAKHLEEYEQAAAELIIGERIELISELVKYQDHHSKILQYQAQQRNTRTKKQKRDFYMAVIRNNLGWKVKDFKGMSFEEVEAKFKTVWEQIKGGVSKISKGEAAWLKRKGIRSEQESVKKQKTSEEVHEEVKSSNEVPEEKIKELIQLVPIEEVYVEALQVKHPIIVWKRLYDTCGVHHVKFKDMEIFMLVEKNYPLRKALALVMICYKLQVENYSHMATDLVRQIQHIAGTLSLQVTEFPLPEELPNAREDIYHCQKKREATARKIALLSIFQHRVRIDICFPDVLSNDQRDDLECMVTKEEVKNAMWDCGSDKSPGLDDMPNGCNSNFITLIPKIIDTNMSVVDGGLFTGIKLNSMVSLSHLFYADDVIFIGQWSELNIDTLVQVLECFYRASGLRINMYKSKIMGVNVKDGKIQNAASKLGCLVLKTPFTYLGTKVGENMSRKEAWKEVVDKVLSRLSKWKTKTLSIGGRFTLFKSVLGSMSIFHISIFKVPSYVLKTLESIHSRFFNGQDHKNRKASWVKWDNVLTSRDKGGLGVASLYALNRGLMFRWIWQFYSQKSSLWIRVIKAIHGNDGKLDKDVIVGGQTCWTSIFKEVRSLKGTGINVVDLIRLKLGNGDSSLFWEDKWYAGGIIKELFPYLYALELHKHATVCMNLMAPSLDNSFRRRVRSGAKESQFNFLLEIMQVINLVPCEDRYFWSLESEGDFSVTSIRKLIDEKRFQEVGISTRWVKSVPSKVNITAWKIKTNDFPTRFNLSRDGMDIDTLMCPVCKGGGETTSHLFFQCVLSKQIMRKVSSWWNVDYTDVSSYEEWRIQMHNDIMAAGSKDRPPMLATRRYAQWQSRFMRYVDTKPNMKELKKCIFNGPYGMTRVLVLAKPTTKIDPAVPEHTDEIYSIVDACKTAQEMWTAIEPLQQGKEVSKPRTPPSLSASKEDSDLEQAQRDKDMQKSIPLVAKYFTKIYKPTNNNLITSSNSRNKNVDSTLRTKNDRQTGIFRNQRIVTVAEARETVVNQEEKCVTLSAEQSDWLQDTNEELDEQELEAHYMYMVPTDNEYNMFAKYKKHSKQPESINNTYAMETVDSNVIPDHSDMCKNEFEDDQNADDKDEDERVKLAKLIANLKLDIDENKKIQKQLRKANTTLTHELNESKSALTESSDI